jgi:hypothetical protein
MRNFTIEDFDSAGQYLLRMSPREIYCRDNNEKFEGYSNTSYLSTIIKKVGYITNNYKIGDGEQIYTLTDMSDGLTRIGNFTAKSAESNNYEKVIWQGKNGLGKQKLINWLNNPELSQEHRFATQEEIVRVVLYQSSRWRN